MKAGSERDARGLSLLIWGVAAAGLAGIGFSVIHAANAPAGTGWVAMAAIAIIVAPASAVSIPGIKAKIMLGDIITFVCLASYGPIPATLVALGDASVASLRITKNPRKFAYNIATSTLSVLIGGSIARLVFPALGAAWGLVSLGRVAMTAAGLSVFAGCYFLISTALIASYIALAVRESVVVIWRENLLWTSLTFAATSAAAVAGYYLVGRFGYLGLGAPLLVVLLTSHFYRTYFERLRKADLRAHQMEERALRAIETLVTTLSATGSLIPGNLRRAARLAVTLGEDAGCGEETLKAIRVAALLRDVGNVAVPQYILDKPGALTCDEFSLVKKHPEASARIVESMGYPEAVADIVCCHHEHFDGTGYPRSLKGPDIPIGARVLAIVDYYDALTSDRPYRPRFSRRQAVSIMAEQAGKAFDPSLLEKFLALVQAADEEACRPESDAEAIQQLGRELASGRLWQVA